MRRFNLKGEWLMPHAANAEAAPGRRISPEPMRLAEPGWWQQPSGERVMRREGEVSEEEHAAAREWLRHVEAGRIGTN